MFRSALAFICAATLAVGLLSPTGAAAVTPIEDPRAVEARKACAAGKVERGIELLAAIVAESNDRNAVYNQARCYQQNGRPAEAVARFREYLRLAPDVTAAERAQVMGFIQEGEQEIDNRARRAATTNARAQASTDLAASAAAPGRPPLRLFAIGAAAVGAAALLTGALFSWQVHETARELEQPGSFIDRARYDQLNRRGQRAESAQSWAYAGAAVAWGASAALFLLDRRASGAGLSLSPGPGALTLAGRF